MYRFVLLLLIVATTARSEQLSLFASNEPLNVVLELPLRPFLKHAAEHPVESGRLQYTDADGKLVSLDIKMTTRGNSRLAECRFPPLSMTFAKKKRAIGTIFEGQKRLKIVTRCHSQSRFRLYQLQEYSIYRAFNALTDVSFRVRQLNVTYRDTENAERNVEGKVFLIESVAELADRLQLERPKVNRIPEQKLDPFYTTLSAMFHFLIGNTDWSVTMAPANDRCCHNGKVVAPVGASSGWMVVPYDFDQAGIINTVYAMPAEQLPIRSVRQRLYRGRCIHSDYLDATVAVFNDHRQQLEALLVPTQIENWVRKSSLSYIDNFYRIINNPKQRERHFYKRCLGG